MSDSDSDIEPASWGAMISAGLATLFVGAVLWILGLWLNSYAELRERCVCPRAFREPKKGQKPVDPRLRESISSNAYFVKPLLSFKEFSERWMVLDCGIDAVVYMRLLDFGCRYTILALVYIFPLSMAMNYLGEATMDPEEYADFDDFTLAHLKDNDSLLWWHLAAVLLNSVCMVYLINTFSKDVFDIQVDTQKRFAIQQATDPTVAQCTVLLSHVPAEFDVKSSFNKYYSGTVSTVMAVVNPTEAMKLRVEEDKLVKKLDVANYKLSLVENKSERPKHKTGLLGCVGETVDSIETYTAELKQKHQALEALAAAYDEPGKEPLQRNAAFVTFNDAKMAALAAQVTHSLSPFHLHTQMAPEPTNVIWPNLAKLDVLGSTNREKLVRALVVVMILFYYIPVAFCMGMATVSNLTTIMPFLEDPLADEATKAVVEGLLPAIVLAVFTALVPIILKAFYVLIACRYTVSSVDLGVTKSFDAYMFCVVFGGGLLAGTLFGALETIIDDPVNATTVIAGKIPSASLFFICFVIVKTGSLTMDMLAVNKMIAYWVLTRLFKARTAMQFSKFWKPRQLNVAKLIPQHLFVLLVVIAFSSISPVVIPVGAIYFVYAYFAHRFSVMYNHEPCYDSGGSFWSYIRGRIIFCLNIYQLLMVLLLALKQGPPQAAIALVIWVATRLKLSDVVKTYPQLSVQTVPICAMYDGVEDDGAASSKGRVCPQFDANAYKLPALAEPMSEQASPQEMAKAEAETAAALEAHHPTTPTHQNNTSNV